MSTANHDLPRTSRDAPQTGRRVLVIGLDGATFDLVRPWVNEGKLPALARLMAQGSSSELASTIHPVTMPAWVTFMTGRNQGQHAVYDHVRRREGSYEIDLLDATDIKAPLVFDYLGARGLRSISINMPLTYPPRPIKGLMVSGLFGTITGPGIAYPPSLYERIAQVAPGYVVHPDFQPRSKEPLKTYLDDLLRSVDDRFNVAEMLLAENPWELGVVVFTATDQVQHAFWHLMEQESSPFRSAIFDVYRRIDDNLHRLLQFADEDTLVLVMSDHGAGKLHAMVNLNRWLANEGYLTFVEGQGAYRRSSLINRVATAYKRYLPVSWRAWIRRSLPGSFKSAKEKMESQLFASAIAWQKTRVYSLGACGNIFINLKGREPAGTVEAGSEYEALRDEVAARLTELRSPQGKPLVRQVLRREEVYHGRYLDLAPDLVVTWHDYGYWGRARYDQITTELFETDFSWEFGTLPLSGTHRPDGILIACGGDVIPGQQIEGARLVDLMPSIMSYLQLPIPRTLDGEVLADLFRAGAVEIRFADADEDALEQEEFSFSASEEDRIKQHLENLGYL